MFQQQMHYNKPLQSRPTDCFLEQTKGVSSKVIRRSGRIETENI